MKMNSTLLFGRWGRDGGLFFSLFISLKGKLSLSRKTEQGEGGGGGGAGGGGRREGVGGGTVY